MNKKLIATTILLSSTSIAHAGFFDLFTSEKEPTHVVETITKKEVAKVAPEAESSSMMGSATDMAMGLLPTLTKSLGVSDTQAEGGMGSLMQMAKGALSKGDFNLLSKDVPNMDTLLATAPSLSSKGSAGDLTSMLSSTGGLTSSIGGIAQLTQQFKALGLSADMIVPFAKTAIEYLSGDDTKEKSSGSGDLLQKGLSALLN